MTNTVTSWTAQEQATILRIADLLIPGGAGMPKASATADYIDATRRICEIRPDLVEPTKKLVREFGDASGLSIESIRERQPDLFVEVSELFAGAYFVDHGVISTLEYRDLPTIPLDDETTRVQEQTALVQPVMNRPSIFRETIPSESLGQVPTGERE